MSIFCETLFTEGRLMKGISDDPELWDDVPSNLSKAPSFSEVAARHISRRAVLAGGIGGGLAALAPITKSSTKGSLT